MNCQNHPEVPATAYCRNCGKPVCEQCRRDAFGTVYCEEHAPAPAARAAEPAGFSVIDGFASSSAMMRRMDAKISSMEGSWTFAGCVISDSTSSTPSHAFYTNQDRICRFQICRLGFSSHKPDLSPDQAPLDRSQGPRPCAEHRSVAAKGCQTWRESLCCPQERYVRAIIDCKQRADA